MARALRLPARMILLASAIALALQIPQGIAQDTLADTYDTSATRVLVEHAIAGSGDIPADLNDYRARVRSSLFLTIASDSARGGDLPATVDEVVSTVRWNRRGYIHQEVLGHRLRVLIPAPYTLGTLLESPWVVPHLYGGTIAVQSAFTPFARARAIQPFSSRGPEFYHYSSGDTVRIRTQGETITLVPVSVRPRAGAGDEPLVVGTFYIDVARGAVARARFGFTGSGGLDLAETETFLELENALWNGNYWLPFRQRRDILLSSEVLGGAVAARIVNEFQDYEINTGWSPTGERVQLIRNAEDPDAFANWDGPVGANAGDYSIDDFSDLRVATEVASAGTEGVDVQIHFERGSHLFRYNRVEGLFLGIGARAVFDDPRDDHLSIYGTAGWAFSEDTPRGELSARWSDPAAPGLGARTDLTAELGVYRRLRDLQSFRPTLRWDWIYSLPALFWGSDTRDYYDVTGVELFGTATRGNWSGRFGGRWESHDSVSVNTQRFLFGGAEEFGPLAGIEPGDHAAIEAQGAYARGPGAFGVGTSTVLSLQAESGIADFDYSRLQALASVRYPIGFLTFAARADAGHVWGDAPPQKLFRFGGTEGLRGYPANAFGGSTAALARTRILIGLPPRSNEPLGRAAFFIIPPLRPSLVLIGEAGWSTIDDDLEPALARLGSEVTDGLRGSIGIGLSIFEDAFTVEWIQPIDADEERDGRLYVGLVMWY